MNDTIWSTESSSQEADNATADLSYKLPLSQKLSWDKVTMVVKCSTLLLFCLVGSFGNTLTLTAIRTTPRLWTKSNMLLASLVSNQLFMTTIQLPYFAIFNLYVYVFAEDPCVYRKVVAIFFPLSKIINHTIYGQFIIIAVDRYVAIVYPLHYETKMTVAVIKCMICAPFVLGLTISGIFYSYLRYVNWSSCKSPYPAVMIAVIVSAVHFTLMLVTVLVYGRILLIALKHRSKISSIAKSTQETSNPISDPAAAVPTGDKIEKQKIKKRLTEFKAARMTAVLVCAYTLPVLPYEIGRIMQACGNTQPYSVKLLDVGQAIANLNLGFDWIIYGMMNRTFRQAFCRLLKIKTNDLNSD